MWTNSDINLITTSTSGSILVLPSSPACNSFPSFLRQVCGQAEKVLPPRLDREQGELGRRVVHRLTGQRVGEGQAGLLTQEDVQAEMVNGREMKI